MIYVQKVRKIKSDLKKEGGILRKKTEFVTLIQNQQHLLGCILGHINSYFDTDTEQTKKLFDKMDADFQKTNYYTIMGRIID